ncbi:MAG TPA: YkvA family protein [Burkholderiales bacterium]|nr:YkvA family protein [Burkholderiales bacterium]
MAVFAALAERARSVKRELVALALAVRHPHTPWYAKLVVAGCVAYALTPVDFIPDAIPVVGFIDDLIFIPLAIALAVRFVPAPVLADCRARSREIEARAPRLSMPAWLAIGAAWCAAVALIAVWTVH